MSSASGVPQSTTNELSVGSQAWTRADLDLESLDAVESSVGLASGNQSHYLIGASITSLGIPGTATIDGVEVTIHRRVSNAGGGMYPTIKDASIMIYDGSSLVGSDKKDTVTSWPTSATAATYGGPTDVWSLSSSSWQAILSGSPLSWGVAISVSASGGALPATAYVDAVTVTVYYTVAAPVAGDPPFDDAPFLRRKRIARLVESDLDLSPPLAPADDGLPWSESLPRPARRRRRSVDAIDAALLSLPAIATDRSSEAIFLEVEPARRRKPRRRPPASGTYDLSSGVSACDCEPGGVILVAEGFGVVAVAASTSGPATRSYGVVIVFEGFGAAVIVGSCTC